MPWEVNLIQDGSRQLVLRRRGAVLELRAGPTVLLSSAALETERAFGRLVAGLPGRPRSPHRVLVGGLGFGATARGVLDAGGPDLRLVVAEKVSAVERLVRGELAELAGDPLGDPRTTLVLGDVADVIGAASAEFDAILLDVDNGPDWASFRENARLYTPTGLNSALRALADGGLLGIWSGYRADAFLARLRSAGFSPSFVPLYERNRVRARAYLGEKAGAARTPEGSEPTDAARTRSAWSER
ncbi:MAG: spermidine synthase [Polyangiaceae bacterium]